MNDWTTLKMGYFKWLSYSESLLAQNLKQYKNNIKALHCSVLWSHCSLKALPDAAEDLEPVFGAARNCYVTMGPQAHPLCFSHFSHLVC